MPRKLERPLSRKTNFKFLERDVVVTLLPGDVMEFHLSGRTDRFRLPLREVFVAARRNTSSLASAPTSIPASARGNRRLPRPVRAVEPKGVCDGCGSANPVFATRFFHSQLEICLCNACKSLISKV